MNFTTLTDAFLPKFGIYSRADMFLFCLFIFFCFDLFRSWRFANETAYVGLSYYGPAMGDNEYMSFFLSSLVEIPSYLACWFLMDVLGRRWPMSVAMMIGGIAAVCTAAIPEGAITCHPSSPLLEGKKERETAIAVTYSCFLLCFFSISFSALQRKEWSNLGSTWWRSLLLLHHSSLYTHSPVSCSLPKFVALASDLLLTLEGSACVSSLSSIIWYVTTYL